MTTINTTSIKLYNKFLTYFKNKRLQLSISHTPTNHSITIYNLTTPQANLLLKQFTNHFHLIKNQSFCALAA